MYMYMYIYIYIYTYTQIYIYKNTCVSEPDASKLMQPFSQVARARGGTGLGRKCPTYIYVYMYTCIYTHTCISICKYV